VDLEQRRGEQGNPMRKRSKNRAPQERGLEGQNNEEINKEGIYNVDRKIEEMKACHVKVIEMVIQGKGQVSDKSAWIIIITR
jgi:hypothetical protein